MRPDDRYWLTDREGPFVELLATLDIYCHPDAGQEMYEELIELARDPEPPEHMQEFKRDLRLLLTGALDQLPEGALWKAAQYSDSSDEAFLKRLWRDLYVDDPIDPSEHRVDRNVKTEIEPYWRESGCGQYDTLLSTLEHYRRRYDELCALARSSGQAPWMLVVKGDLRHALRDPSRIPAGALWTAARYSEENDETFLRRLWRDLYGDEPTEVDSPGRSV